MAARAISTATISFGLVSIPVKLYSTGESSTGVHFNMLHRSCGTRLKQQMFCPRDQVVVERKDVARGYEFAKGQYVLFTDEEYKALQQEANQQIEITEFLPTTKVDPIFFEGSWYLGPDKGGDRAYKLLARALEDSGRSAIARYAARGKQYLVMVRPLDGGLVLQQLRYPDEIRSIDEVPTGSAEIKEPELELALQIVRQAEADTFDPSQYEDDVRKRVLAAIERKVAGQEITEEPAEEPRAQVIDLMEALKASLAREEPGRRPAQRAAAKAAGRSRSRKKKTGSGS